MEKYSDAYTRTVCADEERGDKYQQSCNTTLSLPILALPAARGAESRTRKLQIYLLWPPVISLRKQKIQSLEPQLLQQGDL